MSSIHICSLRTTNIGGCSCENKPQKTKENKIKKTKENIFEVVGAGHIRIGEKTTAFCGDAIGFIFETDWNRRGRFTGGVIDKAEAEKLAKHIIKQLNEK